MSITQTEYKWLENATETKMIAEAVKLYGTVEGAGKDNNKTILQWAAEVGQGLEKVYVADEIPWCGLFVAVVAKRAGKEVVKDPLWALNWGTFGEHVEETEYGDVLVFVRTDSNGKKAGHVGIYIGEDAECYHVLGGNQSNKVCITRIQKERLYTARRPKYNNKPLSVKKVILSAKGEVSKNEA